jgi:hypothetical protein
MFLQICNIQIHFFYKYSEWFWNYFWIIWAEVCWCFLFEELTVIVIFEGYRWTPWNLFLFDVWISWLNQSAIVTWRRFTVTENSNKPVQSILLWKYHFSHKVLWENFNSRRSQSSKRRTKLLLLSSLLPTVLRGGGG